MAHPRIKGKATGGPRRGTARSPCRQWSAAFAQRSKTPPDRRPPRVCWLAPHTSTVSETQHRQEAIRPRTPGARRFSRRQPIEPAERQPIMFVVAHQQRQQDVDISQTSLHRFAPAPVPSCEVAWASPIAGGAFRTFRFSGASLDWMASMKNCRSEIPLRAALLFASASNRSGSSMVVRMCHNYATN